MTLAVIEESITATWSSGMLLPPFGDLSHTSILYYWDVIEHYNIHNS